MVAVWMLSIPHVHICTFVLTADEGVYCTLIRFCYNCRSVELAPSNPLTSSWLHDTSFPFIVYRRHCTYVLLVHFTWHNPRSALISLIDLFSYLVLLHKTDAITRLCSSSTLRQVLLPWLPRRFSFSAAKSQVHLPVQNPRYSNFPIQSDWPNVNSEKSQ